MRDVLAALVELTVLAAFALAAFYAVVELAKAVASL